MASIPPRHRRTTTKSPQVDAGPGTAEDRKEKKRASDRLAQREHRRRQREYIDELETQLRLLKEEGDSDSIAALVTENERLKSELKQLREFASSIQLALSKLQRIEGPNHPVSPAPSCSRGRTEAPKPASIESPHGNDCSDRTIFDNIVQSSGSTSFPGPSTAPHQYAMGGTTQNDPERPMSGSGMSKDILESASFVDPMLEQAVADTHAARETGHGPSNLSARRVAEDITYANIDPPLLSKSAWERLGQLDFTILPELGYTKPSLSSHSCDTTNLPAQSLLPAHDRAAVNIHDTPPEWPSHVPHKCIPNILFPALRDDELLYAMVDNARWQAVLSGTKIPKPQLIDCVLDSTANQFSLELKQYLEPMRRLGRNEEYFASYWLVATLIRWYVHQEDSFYNQVPSWLRPTSLEIRISHPLLISFMPWPLLRNQLILDFHIHEVPIHPIMTALGESLEIKLSCAAGGLALGEEDLTNSLRDLRNWKLKPGFFDRHPQFRDAYQQYAL